MVVVEREQFQASGGQIYGGKMSEQKVLLRAQPFKIVHLTDVILHKK
ncbi:UNVERIFIED_ORG: hypothetical protein M2414_004208 [Rahnella aquatilis]